MPRTKWAQSWSLSFPNAASKEPPESPLVYLQGLFETASSESTQLESLGEDTTVCTRMLLQFQHGSLGENKMRERAKHGP